jgi:hypothetical protein
MFKFAHIPDIKNLSRHTEIKILDKETAIQRHKQREHHNIPRGCSCLNELLAMMIGYN